MATLTIEKRGIGFTFERNQWGGMRVTAHHGDQSAAMWMPGDRSRPYPRIEKMSGSPSWLSSQADRRYRVEDPDIEIPGDTRPYDGCEFTLTSEDMRAIETWQQATAGPAVTTPALSGPEPTVATEPTMAAEIGIGGINIATANETPALPSVEALERVAVMERQARRCRRCGQTDVFDGAMFTTMGGELICDDCV